jgi:hypothetical protein
MDHGSQNQEGKIMLKIGDMVTQVKNKANTGIVVDITKSSSKSKHTIFLVEWFDYHGVLGYSDYELVKVS